MKREGEPWCGQLRLSTWLDSARPVSEVVHAFKAGRETSLPFTAVDLASGRLFGVVVVLRHFFNTGR